MGFCTCQDDDNRKLREVEQKIYGINAQFDLMEQVVFNLHGRMEDNRKRLKKYEEEERSLRHAVDFL